MQCQAPFFTIFIPTFNRAALLPRALASIERQTFRDFEVLIVDDGSTDRTRDIVAAWCDGVNFPVNYVWQENAGKIAAYNRAIDLVNGFLMVLLDSDDELTPRALELFHLNWNAIPQEERDRYAGVEGLSIVMPSGEVAGQAFPEDGMTSTYPEMRYKYGISGDKRHALRTSVMREFPFPLFPGEQHNRESLIWCRMAKRYVFRYFNAVVQQIHYQDDGLSAITSHRRRQSPRGFSLAFLEMINDHAQFCSPEQVRRDAGNYVRYALHAGIPLRSQQRAVKEKRLWWRALPGGVLHWLADRLHGGKSSCRGVP
jgi:glycosyltransferase involved in cell wall biosynthesis